MMEYEIRHISLARYSKLLLGLYTKGVSRKCPLPSLSCYLILSCHIQYRVSLFILSFLCRCRHPHHFTLPVLTSFADEPYTFRISAKNMRGTFSWKKFRYGEFDASNHFPSFHFPFLCGFEKRKKHFLFQKMGEFFLPFSAQMQAYSQLRDILLLLLLLLMGFKSSILQSLM